MDSFTDTRARRRRMLLARIGELCELETCRNRDWSYQNGQMGRRR
jgi:hypothetical protein